MEIFSFEKFSLEINLKLGIKISNSESTQTNVLIKIILVNIKVPAALFIIVNMYTKPKDFFYITGKRNNTVSSSIVPSNYFIKTAR